MKLSKRVQNLKSSATLAMASKAKNMKAQGLDIVDLSIGEPDFDTPENIKAVAKEYIDKGYTKYTQSGGIPELREAICKKLKVGNALDYKPNQVVVTCGAKQALYNAIQATIDDGDEVIIIAPYWVTYPDHTLLAGGKPVILETSYKTNFKITADDLKNAITPKTKMLILNTPSNPTGSTYTADELKKIGKIIKDSGITVIADDIYEKITYDGFKHVCIATVCPEIKEQTIVVNGLSKSHSMTGWRVGYVASPENVAGKIQALQVQQISGITSFVQKAAVEALNGPQTTVATMVSAFEKRRNFIFERLQHIKNINITKPTGAFYAFPEIGYFLGKSHRGKKISTDLELAELLLTEYKVASIAGSAFGAYGYIRFSYATSLENIEKGMKRFEEMLNNLK